MANWEIKSIATERVATIEEPLHKKAFSYKKAAVLVAQLLILGAIAFYFASSFSAVENADYAFQQAVVASYGCKAQ